MKIIGIFLLICQLSVCLENDLPVESQASTVANFIVHPEIPENGKNSKPMFEFMPHFDKSNYDFMIPEGKNNQESVAAVIQFFGLLFKPTPKFQLVGDEKAWFKIGEVETVKEPNYMISSVPILTKEGVDVIYQETNKGTYSFKIEAKGEGDTAETNINVEVLSFGPAVQTEKLPTGENIGVKSLEPTMSQIKTTEQQPLIIDNETSPVPLNTEPHVTEPLDFTIETELSSITDISLDELERKLQNEAAQFTPTISRTDDDQTTLVPLINSAPIDFEPIAPIPSEVAMPPILLQFVEVATQLPVNEITINEKINNGFVLENYEIRAILNESVSKELLEITVEPSDIFDIRPHFVLSRMPSQLVIKNQLLTEDKYSIKVKIQYAEITSPTFAELTINAEIGNSLQSTIKFEKEKYEFSVDEKSFTGAMIGKIHAINSKGLDNSPLIYSLIGKNSELFTLTDGVITLLCPTTTDLCLDYEKQKTYYLIAMATSLDGISSDPVTIIIHTNDVNDNSPVLAFPDKTVKIQDGRILEPFLLKVNDKDSNDVNQNTVIFEGSAANFLSPELVSANVYRIQVSGVPEIGGYILDIIAKDTSNKGLKESRKSLKIEVLNSAGKARFTRARYERKIAADKLHRGTPLIQLEFNGEAIENIQFIFLDGNPGWLSIEEFGGNVYLGDIPKDGVPPGDYTVTIAALERQTQQIIDRCEIVINIEGIQISRSLFNAKVFSITVPKEIEKNVVINPLQKNEKRKMSLILDSIYAWGDSMEIVHIPSDIIKIDSDTVVVNALAMQNLRGLQFQIVAVDNPNDRALITIYVSSEATKYANEKMERSKPKFALPWISEALKIPINLPEETPLEHTVIHLPAFNPETGETINNITIKGSMAEYFTYDTSKNSLVVSNLIDYEALELSQKTFELEIIADNPSSPTSANLIVTVQNLDDNSPKILFFDNQNFEKPLKLKLSENSPPGKILIEFKIYDADAEHEKRKYDKFNFKLIGEIAGNFQIQQKEKSYILATSPSTNLDREIEGHSILLLEVNDQAGNTDTIPIIIEIIDDNDNRPMIESSNKHCEIVENWPIGTLLTKVIANDKDEGINKMVKFTLSGPASQFLTIDENNGVIKTNSSLHGLSSFEPYRFQVVAMDSGNPQFTSSADFDVRIIETSSLEEGEEQGVKFTNPAVDFILSVSEDALPNTRLLTAEASYISESVDRTVQYSLEPVSSVDNGWLSINSNNGDIFVQSGFDYERQRVVTVKIIASSVFDEKQNATRLLRIKVTDVDDNNPIFLYGSKSDGMLTFIVDDVDGSKTKSKEKQKIGKVQAYDADSKPFNSIYYYLLPICNPVTDHYEIDLITGEIYELKSNEISRKSGQILCVLTSSIPDVSSETLRHTEYDKTNSSMTRFAIQTISTMMNEELSNQPQIPAENNTIVVFDSSTSNYHVPFDLTLSNTTESSQFLYKLQNLQFFSFKEDKGILKPNIEIFVDPNTAAIRVDPEIVEASEGIYEVYIQAYYLSNGRYAGDIISQIHRVNDNNKLKFVFDYPLEELGMRIDNFKKELQEILSANSSESIRPVFSVPEQYKDKKRQRSAVCFHLAKPNELISLNDSIKLTATKMNSNEKLMSLYQQFEVVNIDSCKSEANMPTAAASTFSQNTLLIVAGVLIAILLLFSCIAYTCFVTRYREFLKKQNQKLRDAKPPLEPFAIPQFIDHRRI